MHTLKGLACRVIRVIRVIRIHFLVFIRTDAMAWLAVRLSLRLACMLPRGGYSTYFTKSKSVHTLKGLALPRACHSGEIALAGSRHLRSTLAAAPVLFAHAVVTEKTHK